MRYTPFHGISILHASIVAQAAAPITGVVDTPIENLAIAGVAATNRTIGCTDDYAG